MYKRRFDILITKDIEGSHPIENDFKSIWQICVYCRLQLILQNSRLIDRSFCSYLDIIFVVYLFLYSLLDYGRMLCVLNERRHEKVHIC